MVAGPNPAEGSNFAPDSSKGLDLGFYSRCRIQRRCCIFQQRPGLKQRKFRAHFFGFDFQATLEWQLTETPNERIATVIKI